MSMEQTATVQDKKELDLGRPFYGSLLVGIVCLVIAGVVVVGKTPYTGAMLQSYLWSFIVFMGLTLGCFTLTLLHHTVKGSWGSALIRIWEAGGSWASLAIMGLLFIPVVATVLSGSPVLYPWADPAARAADPILHHREPLYNPTAWTFRWLFLVAMWSWIAWGMRKSTLRQEKTGDVNEEQKRANYAAPGLVFTVLSITLAFTDWAMSLDTHWSSTMYGAWFVVGQGLFALAFGAFIFTSNATKKPYAEVVSPSLIRDFGNMLLALTMFWAYTAFSQFLIIWSGNLPEYTQYYVQRARDSFGFIGLSIIPLQFFIPFMVLLSPRVKAVPKLLRNIAFWIMIVRMIDLYWVIMPVFPDRSPIPGWTDAVAFLGIGGIWLAIFSANIRQANLLPTFDNRLREAAHSHA